MLCINLLNATEKKVLGFYQTQKYLFEKNKLKVAGDGPLKKPKTQVTEELIQVVSIEYVVNSSKHPNYHLNGFIDRYPIEEIEGYGVDFQREDVSVA